MKKSVASMLRVAATVTLLGSAFAAPALATSVNTPTVVLSNRVVGGPCNYTITFGVGKQLKAPAGCTGAATVSTAPGAWALPSVGDNIVFTADTSGDVVTLTPDPTLSIGAVAFVPAAATGGYAAGVITFDTAGQTATVTATTPVSGTWAQTAQSAVATVSALPGAYALPEVGDVITFTSALATDDVTLTVTSGTVGVVMSGAGTYTAATGVIDFAAAGETATVTATTAGAGTWAQTAGGPTVTAVTAGGTRVGTGTGATSNAVAARPWVLPDDGDDITITATGADNGTITVTSGSVTATPTAGATVAGGAPLAPATITPLSGAVAWTVANKDDTIKVEADVARTDGTWTITGANANAAVSGGGTADTITMAFPTGTSLANITDDADADCTVGASSGIGLAALPITPAASVVDATGLKLTVTVPVASIGAAAIVQVVVGNVVNPPATGDYTLTVKTSADTTPVVSTPYALAAPSVPPQPGVVKLYNPSGILMASFTGDGAVTAAVNSPSMGVGFTIECGPGTYDMEDIDGLPAGLTIVATDGAGVTTLGDLYFTFANLNTVDLDGAGVVLDGFTIGGLNVINILADHVVVKNCTFMFYAGDAVTIGAGGTNAAVQDCTFWLQDPLFGIPFGASNTGVVVGDGVSSVDNAAVAGCTFNLDDGNTGVIVNGQPADDVAVADCTLNGPGGTGVRVTDGRAEISDTTVSGLGQALKVDGPTADVTVKGSTISECGASPNAANWWAGVPAILVSAAARLKITSSTITGSPNDIIEIQANADNILIMSNDLSGNAKGIDNNDAVNTVNATLNWWGNAAGPAAGFNSGLVDAAGYTGTTASSVSSTTTSGILAAKATQGVDVTITVAGVAWVPAAGDIIAVARYTGNPQGGTPLPTLPDGFYDVLVVDSVGAAQTEVLIKLYHDEVTKDTVAYAWSDLQGMWVPCSNQGSNWSDGFVWIKVTAAADSVPTIIDLQGTPFALVKPTAQADEPPPAPTILTPTFGEGAAPVRPVFTWSASPGATRYELSLTEELGLDDKFTIIEYSATAVTHGHVASEQLRYGTTYNWRVRAVSDVGAGEWTTSFFTTVPEPEPESEPVPPVAVKEIPASPAPEVIVEMPPAEAPVQVVQVTPGYLLWTVVAVGSVLLITIVVLITRTRRVI